MKTPGKDRFVLFLRRSWFWMVTALLACTAILQMILLFGEPFILNDDKEPAYSSQEGLNTALYPEAIYVTLGGMENGSFVKVVPEDNCFSVLQEDMYALLKRVVAEGEMGNLQPLEVMDSRRLCAVLKLPFPADEQTLGGTLWEELEGYPSMNYSTVAVYPSLRRGEPVRLLFLEKGEGQVREISAGSRDWEENLSLYRDLLDIGSGIMEGSTRYVDAGLSFGNLFEPGTFVSDTEVSSEWDKMSISSAFFQRGDVRYSLLRSYINSFFEYPDAANRLTEEDALVYTSEKVTLKVTGDGYMHYMETLTDAEKTDTTLNEAYRTALTFLQGDLDRVGSLYQGLKLVRILRQQQGFTFWFDYTLMGRDLELSQMPEGMEDMEHPVSITVVGSSVRECRRWVLKEELKGQTHSFNNTWKTVMDLAATRVDISDIAEPPREVYYYNGHALIIAWQVRMKDGSALYLAD